VLEPGAHLGAALVAHGAAEGGDLVVVGDDHTALAGGHLLIGVEGEGSGIAKGAELATAIVGPEGLAGVVNDAQIVLRSDLC
jgi:hypothetical protein